MAKRPACLHTHRTCTHRFDCGYITHQPPTTAMVQPWTGTDIRKTLPGRSSLCVCVCVCVCVSVCVCVCVCVCVRVSAMCVPDSNNSKMDPKVAAKSTTRAASPTCPTTLAWRPSHPNSNGVGPRSDAVQGVRSRRGGGAKKRCKQNN